MDQIFNKIANILPEPLNPGGIISRTIDILGLLSTILCYLFIPLDYTFEIDDSWSWIKKGTAIMLFVQILMKFNTSQFYHGSLVSDRTHIAWNYLSSSFILDLISTLSLVYCPFDYASLIFFLRFLYSPSISFKLQEICAKHKRISGILNLLRIFLFALYNCHVIACFWFYIARYETQDNPNNSSWINKAQLSIQASSKYELYLQSIYFAVMTLTSSKGEIFPQTNREKIFIVFVSVYACCFVAYIVYSVIQACKQFNQNSAVYLTQLASLNKYLDSHSVSYGLCDQARKYVEYINSEGMKDRQESIKSLDNLSANLREEIAKDIFTKSFTRNPILNRYFSNKMFMEALSMKVREQVFGPGEVIVKSNRNDVPCLYFIIQGEVELYAEIGERGLMQQGSTKIFNVLGKSDCFGQLEFFQQTFNTSVSARARGFTHVMAVSLLDFQEAVQRFPEQKEAFCYLKDCVNLNSQFDLIGISCYSCHSDSHTLMSCPYLFYHQGRQRILIQSEAIQHQIIASFKRSQIRKKFHGLSSHARLLNTAQAFHQANQDILNTSMYDEYQEVEEEDDEDESEQRSFRKQQTCPHFDERSNYTRHTSKKTSLKQTQTAEEASFQRKNSKNQSLKMLNPNSNNSNNPEDIHEKSQISRISQFSNRPRNQQEPFSEDKKGLLTPAASQPNLDSELAASQNRRRTHSGVSNIIGSRKSPFPSDREMNRSYSGSLISSLRLSEADRRVLALEEKGTDGSKQPQQMGSAPPNVVVIKVNEGEEYSIVSHRGGPYSGVSSSQFAPSFEPSSDYQARRRNSNFSLISRGIVQSSQLGSSNQPIDEISELRLDQTNRFRENSFVPNNLMENDLPQLRYYLNNNNNSGNVLNLNNSNFNNLNILGSNHLNIDEQQDNFEEQQNFKIYFAHNNLQNIINQPKTKKGSNQLKPANSKPTKRSSFIRVVSVNNKISNHQMVSNSINNNQLDVIPGLMPVNVSPFAE